MIHHLLLKAAVAAVAGYGGWKLYKARASAGPTPSPAPSPQPGPPAPSPSPVNPGNIVGPEPGDTNGLVTYNPVASEEASPEVNPPGTDASNPTGDTSSSDSDLAGIAAAGEEVGSVIATLGAFGV